MKKLKLKMLLSLMLVVVLCFGLLAGCGSGKESSAGGDETAVTAATASTVDSAANQEGTNKPAVTGEKKKVAIVAFSNTVPAFAGHVQNVIKGLEKNGYKDKENVEITIIDLNSDLTLCEGAIEQVKKLKPDLIITDANLFVAEKLVKPLENEGIPIVLSTQVDNAAFNFIDSPEKPGKNITGIRSMPKDLQTKGYELLNEIAPLKDKKAVFISSPAVFNKENTEKALADNNIPLKEYVTVNSFDEYKANVLKYNKDPEIGWVLIGAWSLVDKAGNAVKRDDVVAWDRANLMKPNMTFFESVVSADMLAGLAVDMSALGLQAADMGAKILKGEKPGNIPIEDPKKLTICLNQMTAKRMGIGFSAQLVGGAKVFTDYNGKSIGAK